MYFPVFSFVVVDVIVVVVVVVVVAWQEYQRLQQALIESQKNEKKAGYKVEYLKRRDACE